MVEKLGASNGSMSRTTRISPFAEKIHASTWVVRSLNCTTNYYQLYHMHKTAISFQDSHISYIYIYSLTYHQPQKVHVFFFPMSKLFGVGWKGKARWVVSSSSRCHCYWGVDVGGLQDLEFVLSGSLLSTSLAGCFFPTFWISALLKFFGR